MPREREELCQVTHIQPQTLSRGSAFSYECHQCSRCCFNKRIQVNPYEVARLARNQGVPTTKLIGTRLEPGKPYLKNQPDGACVFLTDRECRVHGDRPLVCRLYPLGQTVTGEGQESFHHSTPHPETKGVYGHDGTVEDFLVAKGRRLCFRRVTAMCQRCTVCWISLLKMLNTMKKPFLSPSRLLVTKLWFNRHWGNG